MNGFARFNEWSPWADLDPGTRYSYSGPATGAGRQSHHLVFRHELRG